MYSRYNGNIVLLFNLIDTPLICKIFLVFVVSDVICHWPMYLKNPFWLRWFFMLVLSAQKAGITFMTNHFQCLLVVILWDWYYKQLCLLVFLTSQWITKHSKQRNISSYVEVVFLEWHWGVIVTPDHISIAKLVCPSYQDTFTRP